jgi:hypothetical protein
MNSKSLVIVEANARAKLNIRRSVSNMIPYGW